MLKKVDNKYFALLASITVLLLLARPLGVIDASSSGTLINRFVKLSDNRATKTGIDYTIGFDFVNTNTIGSVEIEFCSNDPFPATSCTVPSGFDVSNAALTSQVGPGDFVIDAVDTNAHRLVLSRPPSAIAPSSIKFVLTNVNNATNTGSQYARVQSFSSVNASGIPIDQAGIAFSILGDFSVLTEVPPRLEFCVGVKINSVDCSDVQGDSFDYGDFKVNNPTTARSQFNIATNAKDGYTVVINGNTLTSGNNVIKSIPSHSVSILGSNQFGMNMVKNFDPDVGDNPAGPGLGTPSANYAISNEFVFNDGDIIASYNTADNYTLFTTSYLVNIKKSQPAGIYSTTLTYIATGHF